eukprot:SAG31_NODE_39413_length_288_cov_1.074074_1_plen_30_part_01
MGGWRYHRQLLGQDDLVDSSDYAPRATLVS